MRSISKGVFKQVEQLVKKKIFRILRRVLFCIGTLLLYVLVITYLCGALCCYGPSEAARDLFVNSMLETSAAKFVPYLYFSKSRIQEITGENRVIRSEEITEPRDYWCLRRRRPNRVLQIQQRRLRQNMAQHRNLPRLQLLFLPLPRNGNMGPLKYQKKTG